MPARVNYRLIWTFLATGTDDLFAGISELKTVVLVKTLCNSLIGHLLLDSNSDTKKNRIHGYRLIKPQVNYPANEHL